MSYKLEKPCSETDRLDFIVKYNHNKGLRIEEAEKAYFALEKNEIISGGIPVVDEDYESKVIQERKDNFEKEFFSTSLGWIRRSVTMCNGTRKNFLTDLLLPIKAGLESGREVTILAYKTPDFTQDLTLDYMVSLQERKQATPEFIQECLNQLVKDFGS